MSTRHAWPVEHGGRAATATQAGIFHQELARFETPDLYPFMVGISLVGPTLLTHGNPGQQARWLPAIRAGEEVWCQLFSEPNAGSDLAGLEARANGGSCSPAPTPRCPSTRGSLPSRSTCEPQASRCARSDR